MPGGAICPTRDGWGQSKQRGWDERVIFSSFSISVFKISHAHCQELFMIIFILNNITYK